MYPQPKCLKVSHTKLLYESYGQKKKTVKAVKWTTFGIFCCCNFWSSTDYFPFYFCVHWTKGTVDRLVFLIMFFFFLANLTWYWSNSGLHPESGMMGLNDQYSNLCIFNAMYVWVYLAFVVNVWISVVAVDSVFFLWTLWMISNAWIKPTQNSDHFWPFFKMISHYVSTPIGMSQEEKSRFTVFFIFDSTPTLNAHLCLSPLHCIAKDAKNASCSLRAIYLEASRYENCIRL